MRQSGDTYEYVNVYVDDFAIAMKNPKEIVDILEHRHKFKTKGAGPISFYLGMGTMIHFVSHQQSTVKS